MCVFELAIAGAKVRTLLKNKKKAATNKSNGFILISN
jgi:hypothetical protein